MDATVNKENSNSNASPKDTVPPTSANTSAAAAAAASIGSKAEPETNEGEDAGSPDPNAPPQRGKKRRLLGVDPSLIISDGRSKRRKSPTPEPSDSAVTKVEAGKDPKDKARALSLGREIYKKVVDSQQNGESISDPFVKLPPKKQFPDYYEMIKHPMCLDTVRQKLDKEEYDDLQDVVADLGQIFNNAKRYNMKDSDIFQSAKKLHKLVRTFYSRVTDADANPHDSDDDVAPAITTGPSSGPSKPRRSSSSVVKGEHRPSESVDPEEQDVDMGGPSNASMDGENGGNSGRWGKKRGSYMKDGPTVYKLVRPVLNAIRSAKANDGSNREITAIFEKLPERRDLPDYYTMIKDPIALSEIDDRVMGRRYDTWEEFFEQAELMCSNAMLYNEDESDVFRDAQQIKGILDKYRADIEHRLSQPNIPVQKAKSKAAPPVNTPSHPSGPSTQSYPGSGQNGASTYPPSINGRPSASPAPSRPYIAPLPASIISEDIVARLPQYTQSEQQAWIASLTQSGLNQYRQIIATQEARRRNLAGQPPPPLCVPASIARTTSSSGGGNTSTANGHSNPSQPFNLSYRTKPPQPLIKHLDFAFNAPVPLSLGGGRERHTIRLHNLRGVITHALIIGAETAEVEITAILSEQAQPELPAPTNTIATSPLTQPMASMPDIRLKVNGNIGPSAKYVYSETDIGELMEPADIDYTKGKPVGLRWTVAVAHSRLETKLDISCSIAGRTEQCGIFVNRQY